MQTSNQLTDVADADRAKLAGIATIVCQESTYEGPYPGCAPEDDCACWRIARRSVAAFAQAEAKAREEAFEEAAKVVDQRAMGWRARLFNQMAEPMACECEGLARLIRQRGAQQP